MNKSESLSYYGANFSPFFGIVEEKIDEAYVRVRIFGIHPMDDKEAVQTDMLPPALVLYPTTGGQVGGGNLSHNLEVDSWVMGFFLDYPYCMQPVVTNAIQGAAYSMSTYKSGGGEFVGQGEIDAEDSDSDPVNPGNSTNLVGGSNGEKVYNYIYAKLVAEGSSSDPHMHTAAAMGVLEIESPGFRPEVEGGFKGRAWGICQWLDPRRQQLFDRYGRTKRLDQQLDFMWWELNNTERIRKKAWLQTTNLVDATAGFNTFERADDFNKKTGKTIRSHSIFKRRLKAAYGFYNGAKYTGGSGEPIDTRRTPGGSE